jgi:hypothetical protein
VPEDRIVSVGFLTQQDLDLLGSAFTRHFSVQHDDVFADLLRQLDQVEATPLGKGVALMPGRKPDAAGSDAPDRDPAD